MPTPNIHEFQAQEIVDYRQVNNNFSEINGNMLHYNVATVLSYNTDTFETTVLLEDNSTQTGIINRTGNILTTNDTVYVYYWTSITADGYIGIKLGTPDIQGGDSVSIGKYLNNGNNSVLVNDLNNTNIVNIQDNNTYNNLMTANSKVFYDRTLHSGTTYNTAFDSSTIIGADLKLYDVLMTKSQIFGSSNQLNSYSTYDSDTGEYTFKSLHILNTSTILGYSNTISDNRTTYSDTTYIMNNSSLIGAYNTFSIYNDSIVNPSSNQQLDNSYLIGAWNNISKSSLNHSGVIGTSNQITDTALKYSNITGYNNSVDYYYTPSSGNHNTESIYMYGTYNNIHSGSGNIGRIMLLGAYNNFYNNSSSFTGPVFLIGENNRCGDSSNNGIQGSNNYLFGGNNTLNATTTSISVLSTFIMGYSNDITFKGNSSGNTIIGNSINAGGYDSYNNAGCTMRFSNLLAQASSIYCDMFDSTVIGAVNEIEYVRFYNSSLIGYGNNITSTNHTSMTASDDYYIHILGDRNSIYNTNTNLNVFGSSNSISTIYKSTICGDSNSINLNSTATSSTSDIIVLGDDNTINSGSLTTALYGHSNLIGGYNTLITDVTPSTATSSYFGYHTIIGHYGKIQYSSNTDAYKMKMVFGIDQLYEDQGGNGNAVVIDNQGNMNVVGTITSQGADFAEYWEWEDGNTQDEDRRGLFVTLADNGYIQVANSGDKILGIVSVKPTVTGGDDNWEWHGKYLKDVFGEYIYEDVEETIYEDEQQIKEEAYTDENNVFHEAVYETVKVPKETIIVKKRKINPDYNSDIAYTNRSQRKEYVKIAHLGKLVMVDDGTTNTGDYLTSLDNGIATKSNVNTKYVCIKRIDENHIYVLADIYN